MHVVSIITLNNKIFDNVVFFIIKDNIKVTLANTKDKIFFNFLSFFLKIGKFIVSAGA